MSRGWGDQKLDCRTAGAREKHGLAQVTRRVEQPTLGSPAPATPCQRLLPFALGASGFSLGPALVLPASEDPAKLLPPTWGDEDAREVLPTLGEACGSVLEEGLRGVTKCDNLAGEAVCGLSFLGWELRAEVAGPGLWVREQASGKGGSRSPSQLRQPQAAAPQAGSQCPPSGRRRVPRREGQATDTYA